MSCWPFFPFSPFLSNGTDEQHLASSHLGDIVMRAMLPVQVDNIIVAGGSLHWFSSLVNGLDGKLCLHRIHSKHSLSGFWHSLIASEKDKKKEGIGSNS
jgi:hypothetical protein